MSQDSPVGFVVFGFGRAGSIHANYLIRNSQARLKYIVDIDEEKAKEFVKSNYLDTKVVPPSAMETALGDPTVTTTHLHHENQVLSCSDTQSAVCSPKSTVHLYNIDIVDQQKKSRPTGKIFLIRQKDFSTDKNISRLMKLVSHPRNVFLDQQKYSQPVKNSRSLLSTMAFHMLPGI